MFTSNRLTKWSFLTVLGRVPIVATKNTVAKMQVGKEMVYLVYTSISLFITEGKKSAQELMQGRDLEAGADAEAMEGCFLLACFPWLAQLAFL